MIEEAGAHKRFVDGRRIVPLFVKRGANSVDIAKRRKEPERARKQALALKQLQQPSGTRLDDSLAHRWHHDCAGVDQQLGARGAGEPPFSLRVAGVAIGAGGDSQQAAATDRGVAVPGQQGRVFGQQLLQSFDVVVVNDAARLCCRPLQTLAEAIAHFSGEVLPAGVAVFTRDHELRVALRQGRVDTWQLRSHPSDGRGVTSGDLLARASWPVSGGTRETDEQGETSKRSWRPPFINRLYPAETRLSASAAPLLRRDIAP